MSRKPIVFMKLDLKLYVLVTLVALAVVPNGCVNTLVTTLMYLNLGTLVHIAVQRLVRLVRTIRHFIAHKLVADTLSIVACKLPLSASGVVLV